LSLQLDTFIHNHPLFKGLGWVVQKVDNTVSQIAWFVLLSLIHWIAIYLVDSVIQPLNNRGLVVLVPTALMGTQKKTVISNYF